MKYIKWLFLLIIPSFFIGCNKGNAETTEKKIITREKREHFVGNYNKEFNDLPPLHMIEAVKNGITPMQTREDTLKLKNELVRLPDKMELYDTYDLTHSIPFLIPSAARLVIDIATNFRDSLYHKNLPLYRLYLTSITRTDKDITNLTKRNINAIDNSAHRYATTFDISWKRFEQIDPDTVRQVPPERLKLVLAQVLFDLKQQQRCYIKHERKQACFHITVRTKDKD